MVNVFREMTERLKDEKFVKGVAKSVDSSNTEVTKEFADNYAEYQNRASSRHRMEE